MDEVKLLPCDEAVVSEMERIRTLFTPKTGDAEDLITYAKEIVALRATRPTLVTDEVVERVARAICESALGHGTNDQTWIAFEDARHIARAALAAMPTIPQSLGAIPGSHPADQAPSGLGASRFDPERGQ